MKQLAAVITISALLPWMSHSVVASDLGIFEKHDHEEHVLNEKEHHREHDHDDHEAMNDASHTEEKRKEHEDEDHSGEHAEDDHENHKGHDEGGHSEDEHSDGEHAEEGIKLTKQQISLAGIGIETLNPRVMGHQVYAPGTIKANGYTNYLVSPRVDSVVLRRHAALGDNVAKGQPLVTLFSESVAEAQAMFRVASSEWRRVRTLGQEAVGDKRFVLAKATYDSAAAKLSAFGLTAENIDALLQSTKVLGEYTLTAEIAGAVLSDDFHQGQRVEAGQPLMEITDESELWVEAQLSPSTQLSLTVGGKVQVNVGGQRFIATVAQEAHTIDPQTRTRIVRLLVNNQDHQLHPGLFADVYFSSPTDRPVFAVPESALMRGADGDWTLFVESEPGQFVAQEIVLGRTLVDTSKNSSGDWREVSGILPGSRVVMRGAFFVASQIAKGGFDPHNH